jgi:pimeloyl-ACP methyl ester carboxylesterase
MPFATDLFYALYEGSDSQPPVVLIHGAGSSHLCWPVQIRRMAGRRVLVLDLPGHGRSSGTGEQSIAAYCNRLIDFFTELNIHQVVLVGHSMGGAIALQLATQYPELVTGLGLISSSAYLGMLSELVEHFKNPQNGAAVLQLFQQRAFSTHTASGIIHQSMELLRAVRPGVFYGDLKACADFDLHGQIENIIAPAWVAVGADDQITPPACAHYLGTTLPSARLMVIPRAGHMVLVEQPRALSQGLNDFLSRVLRFWSL